MSARRVLSILLVLGLASSFGLLNKSFALGLNSLPTKGELDDQRGPHLSLDLEFRPSNLWHLQDINRIVGNYQEERSRVKSFESGLELDSRFLQWRRQVQFFLVHQSSEGSEAWREFELLKSLEAIGANITIEELLFLYQGQLDGIDLSTPRLLRAKESFASGEDKLLYLGDLLNPRFRLSSAQLLYSLDPRRQTLMNDFLSSTDQLGLLYQRHFFQIPQEMDESMGIQDRHLSEHLKLPENSSAFRKHYGPSATLAYRGLELKMGDLIVYKDTWGKKDILQATFNRWATDSSHAVVMSFQMEGRNIFYAIYVNDQQRARVIPLKEAFSRKSFQVMKVYRPKNRANKLQELQSVAVEFSKSDNLLSSRQMFQYESPTEYEFVGLLDNWFNREDEILFWRSSKNQ